MSGRGGAAAGLAARVEAFLADHPAGSAPDRDLRGARFDAGLAFVHFDEGAGGLGLDPALQPGVEARFLAAGWPDWHARNIIGLGMAAPTIHDHGTPEHRRRFLRPLFTGEEVWCQLFSEPGAGSDLAALATRARPDGDAWVVDGQKVWTTLGHSARRGLLVARTDPDLPKHAGLTFFLLDMASPGVEVRPLRQMTGEAEFNEVYLEGVVVPDADRLGPVGGGWRLAIATLMSERVSLGGQVGERGAGPIGQAVDLYRRAEPARAASHRPRLLDLWARVEVARLTNARALAGQARGTPGPEGAIAKLSMAELNKAVLELCVDLLGPDGMLGPGYDATRPDAAVLAGGDPRRAFLRTRANSIEGGTSEVLRTNLAERVLGLPPEPRPDKGLPWREVPRS